MLCLAVPSIVLHNLSLRAILYDAVLHLGNKFDLIDLTMSVNLSKKQSFLRV